MVSTAHSISPTTTVMALNGQRVGNITNVTKMRRGRVLSNGLETELLSLEEEYVVTLE